VNNLFTERSQIETVKRGGLNERETDRRPRDEPNESALGSRRNQQRLDVGFCVFGHKWLHQLTPFSMSGILFGKIV